MEKLRRSILTLVVIYFLFIEITAQSSQHTYLDTLFSLDPLRIHKRCSKCRRVDVSGHCLVAILCTDTFAAQMQICHLVQSIHSKNQLLFNKNFDNFNNYFSTTLNVLQPRLRFLPLRYQRMQRTCTWIWSFEIHSNVWRYHQIPFWLLLKLRSFWNSLSSSFVLMK